MRFGRPPPHSPIASERLSVHFWCGNGVASEATLSRAPPPDEIVIASDCPEINAVSLSSDTPKGHEVPDAPTQAHVLREPLSVHFPSSGLACNQAPDYQAISHMRTSDPSRAIPTEAECDSVR